MFLLLCTMLLPAPSAGQTAPADGSVPAAGAPGTDTTVAVIAFRSIEAGTAGQEKVAAPVFRFASGALVGEGIVATTRAVVQDAAFFAVRMPDTGEFVPAAVVRSDEDMALLVAAPSTAAFELPSGASGPRAAAGQAVSVLGFPVGADVAGPRAVGGSVSRGMVYGLIELSVAVPPELFGGPVVDEAGELLGIVVLPHQEDPSLAYALPAASIAAAVAAAQADGTLDTARATVATAASIPALAAAALDPRWSIVAGPTGEPPPAMSLEELCSPVVAADMAGAADLLQPAAAGDTAGLVALLHAALSWNVAVCDLRKLSLTTAFLLRRETVGAWLAQGNVTLDRLAAAAGNVRRLRDAGSPLVAASPFAVVLLRFDEELQWRESEVRAGLPTVPAPEPFMPTPPEPQPGVPGPVPLRPVEPLPLEPQPGVEPVPEPELPPGTYEYPDPDSSRVIWAPTAIMPEPGLVNMHTLDLGYWALEYGLNEHVMLSLSTTVPVMNFSLVPGVKFGAQLGEKVWLGLTAGIGFWLFYPDTSLVALLYGGGPSLTIGTRDAHVNFSLLMYGATVFEKGSDSWDDSTSGLFLPNIGGSVRISRMVTLNAELYAPAIVTEDSGALWTYGTIWALAYGLRIFGEHIYGNINFVLPFFEGVLTILQYCPFGFPMLGFGVQW